MKMIRCFAGLACVCAFLLFPSCNKSTVTPQLGNWIGAQDFPGPPRSGAFSFIIGDKTYVGGGYNGGGGTSNLQYVNDCWSFDGATQQWSKIDTFPGIGRERAVAFSVNGKGYMGTGYNRAQEDVSFIALQDFWEYDPAVDQWRQLNNFGGGLRFYAVAFAFGNYGYVGTGYDGLFTYGDFWRYDPNSDSWTSITSYSGGKVQQASIMEIDNKFYLLGGITNNNYVADLWRFDPQEGDPKAAWTNVHPAVTDAQYANFKTAVYRYDAVAFTLDHKGYIGMGVFNSAPSRDIFQYDPVGLTWTKMTPFERAPRTQSVAYAVSGRAYVGTGVNGSSRFDDIDEFIPTADYDVND